MTAPEQLAHALELHQSGRLAEAEAVYCQILGTTPNQPDALHLLGVLHSQTGRADTAADLLRRAIQFNPSAAHYHDNLGMALAAGGQIDRAIDAHRRAIELQPEMAPAHNHLGAALLHKGQLPPAIACFRQAVHLAPAYVPALVNLANALVAAGDYAAAITACRQAIARQPNLAEAHNALGNAFYETGEFPAAVIAYRRALELLKNSPPVLANLAAALTAAGQVNQSIDLLRQALSGAPDSIETMVNLGGAYYWAGDFQKSAELYAAAVARKSDDPAANWNLGLALLLQGDFEHGWPHFHWRWKLNRFRGLARADQPLWDGCDLAGRRILIRSEQGLGDSIQFVRYLPLVVARGGKIILACQDQLRPLFQQMGQPVEQWVSPSEALPDFDAYAPLMSLPMVFKTTSSTIPATVPYLRPQTSKVDYWRLRLAPQRQLKIGLVWAGNIRPDPRRTIPPAELIPIAQVSGTALISLQKPAPANGVTAATAAIAPFDLLDWTAELPDFSDTAALIQNLDLIITIDTAVAHLAGALGKPVWVLLPFVPDWRWMLNRSDSPWYPTMRLFRQPRPGDWKTPILQIVQALGADYFG